MEDDPEYGPPIVPEFPPMTPCEPSSSETPSPIRKGEIESMVEEGETLLEFYAGRVIDIESSQIMSNIVDEEGTPYMATFHLDLCEQAITNGDFLVAKVIKDGSESLRFRPRSYELSESDIEFFKMVEDVLNQMKKKTI